MARPSKRLLNFGDGIKHPCILLICQESQEVSLKLLFRDMEFLPEGGCDDVIIGRVSVAGSLRHKKQVLLQGVKLRICQNPLIYGHCSWLCG